MEQETKMAANVVEEGKVTALISYLTLIGLVVALVMNNDKKNTFASFHIRQSLGITLTGFVLSLIAIVPILGWIIALLGSLLMLVFWIMGFVGAITGSAKPVFFLGDKYQEWFKSI